MWVSSEAGDYHYLDRENLKVVAPLLTVFHDDDALLLRLLHFPAAY